MAPSRYKCLSHIHVVNRRSQDDGSSETPSVHVPLARANFRSWATCKSRHIVRQIVLVRLGAKGRNRESESRSRCTSYDIRPRPRNASPSTRATAVQH